MGFLYLIAFIYHIPIAEVFRVMAFFIPAAFGMAALGYLINDWADIRTDRLTSKKNYLSTLPPLKVILSLLLVLIIAITPWFFLKPCKLIIYMLILQVVFYILYSIPPFRFKNRGFLGILADAFYGHIIPVFVTINLFSCHVGTEPDFSVEIKLFTALFTLLLMKGFRNIMLHQMADRKCDKKAGIKTFVVKYGGIFSLNVINRILLPLEVAFLLWLSFYISVFLAVFPWFLFAFFIFTYMKFSMWLLFVLPKVQLRFKFLYFLNDFYEDWFPFIVIGFLIKINPINILFLIVHMVLFPKSLFNFVADLKTIYKKF